VGAHRVKDPAQYYHLLRSVGKVAHVRIVAVGPRVSQSEQASRAQLVAPVSCLMGGSVRCLEVGEEGTNRPVIHRWRSPAVATADRGTLALYGVGIRPLIHKPVVLSGMASRFGHAAEKPDDSNTRFDAPVRSFFLRCSRDVLKFGI
jgi:hypothetical protein